MSNTGVKHPSYYKKVDPSGAPKVKMPQTFETLDRQMEAYPEETRQAAHRLYRLSRERHWSMRKTGQFIGRDVGTVSKLFAGRYECADYGPITRVIETALEQEHEARDLAAGKRFAMTSTAEKLWQLYNFTLEDQAMSMVFANSQIGKTYNSEHYIAKHPEANAVMIRLPASAPLRATIERLASSLGYSPRGNLNNLKGRVFDGFRNAGIRLLIIDEYSQVFNPHKRTLVMPTIQFLRELWEETGIGMALLTTDIQIEFREFLKETMRRVTAELALPNVPPVRDLKAIAQAYGYAAPDKAHGKLISQIIAESGMLKFTKTLNRGVNLANGKKPSWTNFTEAYEAVAALAKRIGE